jgi:hypothetical protein
MAAMPAKEGRDTEVVDAPSCGGRALQWELAWAEEAAADLGEGLRRLGADIKQLIPKSHRHLAGFGGTDEFIITDRECLVSLQALRQAPFNL